MKKTAIYTFLAMLGMFLPGYSDCQTRYVQGGKCTPGNGTRQNPYNSLALAEQDTSWQKLVVLSSPIALDGGITLRPGTELVGEKSPVDGPLSYDQPTITNTSSEFNGGNGVVVSRGSVSIKNIYFQDTWASAINYDNATNLDVCNVLVTGFNQGEVVVPVITRSNFREIGAFEATTYLNGSTKIQNCIIRDGHSGVGIAEFAVGNKRTFQVNKCEFSGLRSFIPAQEGILRFNVAIAPILFDFAEYKIAITNSTFHDSAENFDPDISTEVIKVESRQGSRINMLVDNCTFRNLAVQGQSGLIADISTFTFDDILTEPLALSTFKSVIKHSVFEELPVNSRLFTTAITHQNDNNAKSHITIKHNTFSNIYDDIVSSAAGTVDETYVIKHNSAAGLDTFYAAVSRDSASPSNLNTKVDIRHNNYVGGNDTGAVTVVSGINGVDAPWNSLVINVEDNCFDGQNFGFAGLIGLDFASETVGAGNATLNAHKNNITGYYFDIFDEHANANYYAQKNWWGQPSGADNILNDGTGIVDVSSPLQAPISCPKSSWCVPNPQSQPPP